MFGINGAKVEFSDFRISAFKPPADEDAASNTENAEAEGQSEGESEDESEEEMEVESDSSEADTETIAAEAEEERPVDSSHICKSKATCMDRGAWCTEMYKDEVPADCVDKFED